MVHGDGQWGTGYSAIAVLLKKSQCSVEEVADVVGKGSID